VRKKPITEIKKVAAIPAENEGAEQSGASVEKIRDILLGSQIKDYDARFARLEDTLAPEITELKETMRRRFESVEGFFRKEAEALSGRLKAEKEERNETLKSIARDLKAASDALSKKSYRRRRPFPNYGQERFPDRLLRLSLTYFDSRMLRPFEEH
jgi:hypothetical protein